MKTVLKTAPVKEPLTLAEVKLQLRLSSGSFADNIDSTQSIAPGSHGITTGYALLGTGVDVLGKTAVVQFHAGTNGATGTVDIKIQESDDGTTYTDWTGGAFTKVTTDNDNATYEKAYTGTKQYIRAAGQVLLAACEFDVTVTRFNPTTAEDDLLNMLIRLAREKAEDYTGRRLITQTWYAYTDEWPEGDSLSLPFGQLQSVTAVTYTDSDSTANTWSTDEYCVDTDSDPGRIVLEYGYSWPSATLHPKNPIKVEYVCGYGTEVTDIPEVIRYAMLLMITDWYINRLPQKQVRGAIENLLDQECINWG